MKLSLIRSARSQHNPAASGWEPRSARRARTQCPSAFAADARTGSSASARAIRSGTNSWTANPVSAATPGPISLPISGIPREPHTARAVSQNSSRGFPSGSSAQR